MVDLNTTCPKCKKPGVANDTCPSCGVVVSRYMAYLTKKEQAARGSQPPANAPYAQQRPVAPEDKKSTGLVLPIIIIVALLTAGGYGYFKYHGGAEEATGSATVATPAAAKAPTQAPAPSNVLTATDANFEEVVLHSATPAVVMFWANNNGPCQMTDPHFAKLADEFAGRIKFVKMNVETSDKTTDQYKVVGYPTLIYFENGEVKKTEVDGGSYWRIWIDLGLPGEPPKTDASKRTLAVNLIYTTTQDFEDDVLKSSTPVIVEFSSSIHLPGLYNLATPELTKLAAELNGRVKVVRLDVAECHNLTEQYNIGGFPAFVLFENGSVTKKAFADAWPADNIADKIKEELGLQ